MYPVFSPTDCTQKRKIFVYSDEGVSVESVNMLCYSLRRLCNPWKYEVATISADRIISTEWEKECVLIVFPGGAANPYHRKLSSRIGNGGNMRIRKFVENGGHYLGICAGAYYACSHIEFDIGGPHEVNCDYELRFFSGIGRGPAMKGFDYYSNKGTYASHFKWEDNEGIAFFQGGPGFDVSQNECTVLSRFCAQPGLDCDPDTPACIMCNVERGCAILCSLHVEFDPWIPKILHPVLEELQDKVGK